MKTKKIRIGVFGCGHMGQALVIGMSACFPEVEFFLFTPTQMKALALAKQVQGTACNKIDDMPYDLDWYILAFKPQNLETFQFNFAPESKIISILAGVSTSQLISKFRVNKIARLMPNIPSSIGEGTNLLFCSEFFSSDEQGEVQRLLGATGLIIPLKLEQDLDLATAFSGSGPALIFELARIFESELIRMTDGRVPAKEIIAKTFLGSAKLMSSEQNSTISFEELRNKVTSQKGVTAEALNVLKDHKLQDIFSQAFVAAYKRTIEFSK